MEALTEQEEMELALSFSESCKRAAEAIANADILLLATGAGMSAESGLPVYRDIADVDIYRQRGLTYAHLCRTTWLEEEPEVFYGFWGACWQDYQRTSPHSGYQTVLSWRNMVLQKSATDRTNNRVRDLLQERQRHYHLMPLGHEDPIQKESDSPSGPSAISIFDEEVDTTPSENLNFDLEPADAFFVFTSNVDGHHQKSGFDPDEVYEVHGTMNEWQCSVPCAERVWRLPHDYAFSVDRTQMKATPTFPKCEQCGAHARPAVQMYYDRKRIENKKQMLKYLAWKRAVLDVLLATDARLVILEIGCGTNVSTVRLESEELLAAAAGKATLVRVNLEYPKCHWRPHLQDHIISIKAPALRTLTQIDSEIKQLRN